MLEAGPQVPPSREVRVQEGITHGVMEDFLLRVHSGGTEDLLRSMAGAELVVAQERLKAAEALAFLIHQRIKEGFGNAVGEDIDNALRLFTENEVLDIHPERE